MIMKSSTGKKNVEIYLYNQEKLVLDGRYRILHILQGDEKSNLYEGCHERLEKEVLIRELKVEDETAREVLATARRLGDFSDIAGIFHVMDQFNSDGKSYVIFEKPCGNRMDKVLASSEKLSEIELYQAFDSLIKSLERLYRAEIKWLPIKAENLYIQEDGSLRLYPEIMNLMNNMKDYVYQISEIMYQCISGKKAQEFPLRILYDELLPLEQLNPKADADFIQIVNKGMELERDLSYISLLELKEALDIWKAGKGQNSYKKRYLLVSGIVFAIMIIGILFGLYTKYEEQIRFWGIETETVMLTPSSEMSQKDYQKAVSVIDKRVYKIAGKQKYLVKDLNGKIKVVMPLKLYEETMSKAEMEQYLTMPLKFSVSIGSEWLGFAAQSIDNYEIIENNEIEKIEEKVHEGLTSYSTGEEVNKFLEITLSDNAAKRLREKFSKQFEVFEETCTDSLNRPVMAGSLDAYRQTENPSTEIMGHNDEWNKLYFPENTSFRYAKEFWQSETFDSKFEIQSEIKVDWRNRGDKALINWVNDEQMISEPAVKLEYIRDEHYELADDGDFLHDIADIAGHLEALNVPYIIGISEKENIVVKVSQKDMSNFVANILGEAGDITLENCWGYNSMINVKNLQSKTGKNGTLQWILDVEDTKDKIEEFMQSVLESDRYIYLTSPGEYCIGKMKIDRCPEGEDTGSVSGYCAYRLEFEDTLLGENGKFTEDMEPLLLMFQRMSMFGNMKSKYNLNRIQYSDKSETVSECRVVNYNWELCDSELDEIKKMVKQEDAYAVVSEQKAGTGINSGEKALNISFNMNVNQDYVEETVQRIRDIWNTCSLENTRYEEVRFFIDKTNLEPVVRMWKYSGKGEWLSYVNYWGWNNDYEEKLFNAIKESVNEKGEFGKWVEFKE